MSFFLGISLYSQNKAVEEKTIFYDSFSNKRKIIKNYIYYDVENLLPVYKTTIDSMHSPVRNTFYFFGKKIRKVSMDVEYIGGTDALLKYQDSTYWNKKNFSGEEVNGSCLYTILFDKNLKIKEVKIIKRSAYDNSKYNYDSVIKKIILSTQGNWKKTNDNIHEKWYFRLGRFSVRP
jgi:hypothetical protein